MDDRILTLQGTFKDGEKTVYLFPRLALEAYRQQQKQNFLKIWFADILSKFNPQNPNFVFVASVFLNRSEK